MKPIRFLSLAVLFSVLLSQAAPGAETNHNFARWEKDIAAFERMDITNPPPKNAVEFIGSSTIVRWKTLTEDFPGQPVFNRGFGGSEIVDSTHFAPRVIFPYAPRMIVFRAGGNDLWAGKSPEQVFADFKEFTATVHAKLPETEIVFISWNPTPARWKQHEQEKELNRLVADFACQTPHLKYIEAYDLSLGADGQPRPELFVADKLHFNADGYKLLAERVRPIFSK
ncbi:MAG: GDSL-type esterase/lipase family protein [Verrucomicrobiales bacterium]|nr:GDSL-type esterase/lipase family protein [Verrucomicrobiales bacterium]